MPDSLVNSISEDLKISIDLVQSTVINADTLYRSYKIPKKTGGYRIIREPSETLKLLQYWAVKKFFYFFPISKYAMAYESGNSTIKTAQAHIKASHLFHTDIRNFFPSITDNSFNALLNQHISEIKAKGLLYPDLEATLDKILFRNHKACMGAPSSPHLSNAIMYDFDNEVGNYCENSKLIYTRYSDDIYISSSKFIKPQVQSDIFSYIEEHDFIPNYRKTHFYSGKSHIKVTGITIQRHNRLTTGTRWKKKIKKALYTYIKNGEGEPDEILGYLTYLKNIEPDYYQRLIRKYSTYLPVKSILQLLKEQKNATQEIE
ncbi:retron St85 family RNA-directed DNA polymerase [Bifidobacterium sp. ESL0732]|uniref:retron St85 family RNA-directed DNA polymerase n=1 Tax=Bifidobacterium sp. ESL0732 TaxID=2983222 RepID=UPI0023F8AAAB|nr:retron St85 family RNA-directed DNA polymerase [Bifidobacterium sp. ESL0732]WEV64536.1 retron St85 family RNA-directed DNA polymerase [Bifidobacterium sp. ESL0732]